LSFSASRGTIQLIFGISGIILIFFGALVLAQAYGIWNVGYNPQTIVQITGTTTVTTTSATTTTTGTTTSQSTTAHTTTSTYTSTTTTSTPPPPYMLPPLYYLMVGWGLIGLGVVAEVGTFALRPTRP